MWALNLEYFNCIPKSKTEHLNCVLIVKIGHIHVTCDKNKYKVKQIKIIVFLKTNSQVWAIKKPSYFLICSSYYWKKIFEFEKLA